MTPLELNRTTWKLLLRFRARRFYHSHPSPPDTKGTANALVRVGA